MGKRGEIILVCGAMSHYKHEHKILSSQNRYKIKKIVKLFFILLLNILSSLKPSTTTMLFVETADLGVCPAG